MSFDKEIMETPGRVTDDIGDKTESDAVGTYQKIEDAVVGGYQKIENAVVSGYQKMENTVVSGFAKMTDKMVEKLFAREGESVEEAKNRLNGNDK